MPNMKTFASNSETELAEIESKTRKELFDLNFQHATRNLSNPMELKVKRRELARVLTAKNSRRA